jgi:hypothetical protein
MRAAIEAEAHRLGAKIMSTHSSDRSAVQFSESAGTDKKQGRLWTDAKDLAHYEALCAVVKKEAVYDRDSGLWVKRTSVPAFEAYRKEKKTALSELEEKNRKYAVQVLGGHLVE